MLPVEICVKICEGDAAASHLCLDTSNLSARGIRRVCSKMSDQASSTTIEKKFHTNQIRKIAFAEVALKRLRSRLSGARNLSKRDELSISISDPDQSIEEQLVDDSGACVDSESGACTESEVGTESRGRDRKSVTGINIPYPQGWTSKGTPRGTPKPEGKKGTRAPEQAITLFAFRLAILEKAARGAGALTFVWATVVLLGGFSSYVSTTDFWVVTSLLLTEGSRIFLLSNELEWQRATSRASFSLYEFGSSVARRSSRAITGEDRFIAFASLCNPNFAI